MNTSVDIKLDKQFDYDYTPRGLICRAEDWYHLATDAMGQNADNFNESRYVAFCFSIEFMLKALLCLDEKNARDSVLKDYRHNLGETKDAVLGSLADQRLKSLIEEFFATYPEFNDRNLIDVRYGKVGSIRSYSWGAMLSSLYKEILVKSRVVVCDKVMYCDAKQ